MTQYPEAWLCRELGMAVVNIASSPTTTPASSRAPRRSTRTTCSRCSQQNAERIRAGRARPDRALPGGPRRLGALAALRHTRGDGHASGPRTSGSSRPACSRGGDDPDALRPAATATEEPLHGCVRCGAPDPDRRRRCASGATRWASSSRRRRRPTGRWSSGSRSPSSCSRSSRGSRSAASGRSRASWRASTADPAGLKVTITVDERRLDRRLDHVPHRRPVDHGHRPRGRVRHQPDQSSRARAVTFSAVVASLGTTVEPLTVDCDT